LLFDLKMGFQLTRENFPLVIFSAGYFLGYLFLYIWYSPIANLPRFLYALYVPILFSLFILAQILRNKLTRPIVKTANLAIFLMICIDIWHTASYGPFFRDFGS